MRKIIIFVAGTPNLNIDFKVADVFLFCKQAICYKHRAITSCGLLHLISQLFGFGDSEGGSPSFIFKLLNFSNMPNPRKNASVVNNSTHSSTSDSTRTVSSTSPSNLLAKSDAFNNRHIRINDKVKVSKEMFSNGELAYCIRIPIYDQFVNLKPETAKIVVMALTALLQDTTTIGQSKKGEIIKVNFTKTI